MATSARKIRIQNPDLSANQISALDADYTSGTSLTLLATSGFLADDIIVVGNVGNEKCDSDSIASITNSTTLVLDTGLDYSYSSGTPVYKSSYNQVEISYNLGAGWLTLATINIQWDEIDTLYVHQGGTDTTSYRFRFYNPASANFSEYSPTLTGAGFTKKQVGYMVRSVRRVVLDPDRKIFTDQEIMRFLTEAKDIVIARTPPKGWWFWKKEDEGTITTVVSTFKYDLDSISDNIEYVSDVRYLDNKDSNLYQLDKLGASEFDEKIRDQDRETDDSVNCYTIDPPDSSSDSGYLKVYPTPEHTSVANTEGGKFYIRYYEPDTDYDSVSDTTTVPLPYILEDYATAQCFRLKGQEDRATYYEDKFFGSGESRRKYNAPTGISLLEAMNNRKGHSLGQPRFVKRFLGRNAIKRLFGNSSSLSSDDYREKYY